MSDTKEIIACPACGSIMKKVFINDAGCHIDICVDGCGGIFFDNREYKKFDEQHENIEEIVKEYKDKNYSKVDEYKQRICPVCKSPMVKHYASSKEEIEMDECYGCGAIFLDYGELEQIRNQFKTEEERSEAFMGHLKAECDISSFEDYKAASLEEMFGKGQAGLINKCLRSAESADMMFDNIKSTLSRFLPF